MSTEGLTAQQIADAGLEGWVLMVHYGLAGLQTRIHTDGFAGGTQLVTAISGAALEMNHQADIDLRAARVDVRLTSGYAAGGVTEVDLQLARRISDIAAEKGFKPESRGVSVLEVGLDTPDHAAIAPFWAAVLDRRYVTGEGFADVGDPNQLHPLIWFQKSGSEEPRQRWHFDVAIDPAQLRPRIEAAVAAGGSLVRGDDRSAILADPDGNRVCLTTWAPDRDLPNG
ncbi:MAG TPA: VOC family protein [Mycobacteriales bacterium]|nr:VOC family protein [Mycobacteriales bacterium]